MSKMNPFIGSLNRLGFLFWFIVAFIIYYSDISFLYSKPGYALASGSGLSGLDIFYYWLLFGISGAILLLAILRRFQNTSLRWWFTFTVVFFPLLLAILFFMPPQKHNSNSGR